MERLFAAGLEPHSGNGVRSDALEHILSEIDVFLTRCADRRADGNPRHAEVAAQLRLLQRSLSQGPGLQGKFGRVAAIDRRLEMLECPSARYSMALGHAATRSAQTAGWPTFMGIFSPETKPSRTFELSPRKALFLAAGITSFFILALASGTFRDALRMAPAATGGARSMHAVTEPLSLTPSRQVPLTSASLNQRLLRRANAGDPQALTILDLRALDSPQPATHSDAARLLTRAAEKGQPVAQYRLGILYERGLGLDRDLVKAAKWYSRAAARGNRKAIHNLACLNTAGPHRNMAEAARLFAKAALLGLSDSQFNLAVLYERGDGVPQSLQDAYKWYAIAASTGDQQSSRRLSVLNAQISAADRSAALSSARSFRALPLNQAANVAPAPRDIDRR
ncbi:MAG: sel1 repeat family protein [Alphaproteobacteria bacterium]|nr:sel1 repeat family protein [Alphaproteobacteria bacterium]